MVGTDDDSVVPVLDRIHHVSFVVEDLEAAVARFERVLGLRVAERGPVATRGAEVAIFKLANINLELVAPALPESLLHETLTRDGEGFFHLAFAVDDVDAAHEQLERRGVRMQSAPYRAYKNWRIAYLESEMTGGISMHIIDADSE
jgi:methylmalonyl-CoA/ethylmalonyl-CoA epimerase